MGSEGTKRSIFHESTKKILSSVTQNSFKTASRRSRKDAFIKTKKKDRIKTRYAAEHGYSLLRISFLELEHIEEILTEVLFHLHPTFTPPEFLFDVTHILCAEDRDDEHTQVQEIYLETELRDWLPCFSTI